MYTDDLVDKLLDIENEIDAIVIRADDEIDPDKKNAAYRLADNLRPLLDEMNDAVNNFVTEV